MSEKYYLTTPLYYVNSKPHIGHSYTNIAADVLARFKRLQGRKVLFLTGTDEHGQKVDKAAQTAGMTPQQYTDQIAKSFKDLWGTLNISYDDFIRTTEDRHVRAVQKVWTVLHDKKEIYSDKYAGFYCTPCETFFADRQVLTEGGQSVCPDCKRPVDHIEEENYFLKISKNQKWLIDYIKSHPDFILPDTRRNEVLGFLENNELQDLCISRPKSRLAWGIQSPISANHVTYVWFDALINYITACGYADDQKKFESLWPADVHIVGKDILRHHAVYWTLLLKALELPMPKMIYAHGWWVQGGEKMSKSKGNVIDPVDICQRFGVDAYRYFLMREVPFGFDGTFSEEALTDRFNHDLANDIGNLLHRTLTMCEKYFGADIPAGVSKSAKNSLRDSADLLPGKIEPFLNKLAFSEALMEIWQVINQANKFIEDQAPWKLSKEGKDAELKAVIVSLLETIKICAQSVWPFMPHAAEAMLRQLGVKDEIAALKYQDGLWGYFEQGGHVSKEAPLFPRIDVKSDQKK